MTSLLVRWSSDRGNRARAQVGELDKTLYSHSASLHPGLKMGTSIFNAGRVTLRWTKSLHATETGKSPGLMCHLARWQSVFLLYMNYSLLCFFLMQNLLQFLKMSLMYKILANKHTNRVHVLFQSTAYKKRARESTLLFTFP